MQMTTVWKAYKWMSLFEIKYYGMQANTSYIIFYEEKQKK